MVILHSYVNVDQRVIQKKSTSQSVVPLQWLSSGRTPRPTKSPGERGTSQALAVAEETVAPQG